MATANAQNAWRRRCRDSKRQLNVMAPVETHNALEHIAQTSGLRGKAEAVAFSVFLTDWLMQQSAANADAAALLTRLNAAFHARDETARPEAPAEEPSIGESPIGERPIEEATYDY